MGRPRQLPTARFLSLAIALGALCVLAQSASGASVNVPNVVGQKAVPASNTLKAAGFAVQAIEVAEGEVGRVHSQLPGAGSVVDQGETVEIRVGIALRVETTVPDAVGRPLDEAVADLSAAYVVEVESVEGPPEQAGLVLDQEPAAGEKLFFRGILRIRAVAGQTGQGSAIVPPLLGRTVAQAKKAVADAGLVLVEKEVEDPVAAPGQIVSQDPPSGAEILGGGTVTVRVAAAPQEGGEGFAVPDVVGLTRAQAEQTLLGAGFVVHTSFSQSPGQTPWAVLDQSPAAGEVAALGTKVTIAVAAPAFSASVPVPSLLGLTGADAQAVLTSAGLEVAIGVQASNLPQGTVIGQNPPPGTMLVAGATVQVSVAGPPPQGGWKPPHVAVPNVVGLTSDAAFAKLVLSGLWPKPKKHMAPNAPLGIVSSQNPAPGTPAFAGFPVSFYVPAATTVPNLINRTRTQAVSLLQQSGLNAAPQGPAIGLGSTKVVSQSHPAGTKIAKGSTISFAYQWTGGIQIQKVHVPNVVGLTKNQAQQALAAKNLQALFQGPNFGIGQTVVTAQNPGAGALVPVGSNVLVVYKFGGGLQPVKVAVPNLIGKTKGQAQALLSAKNLVAQLQGPNFGIGTTKVTMQGPAPGTMVFPGTVVVATYVFTGGIQPVKVVVPNVVNMKPSNAKALLQAKGLPSSTVGPQWGIGQKYVFSQNPAAGSLVNTGTHVVLTVKFKP